MKALPLGVSFADRSEAMSLVPGFTPKLGQLELARRGDFIRMLLKFAQPVPDTPGASVQAHEFLTCVVAAKSGAQIECKVYSWPEKTVYHSVDYGDEFSVPEDRIVTHEQSTEEVRKEMEPFLTSTIPEPTPINEHDAKLRAAAQNLAPVTPEAGKRYWLRNGAVVTVWTYQTRKVTVCRDCQRQLLGSNISNEMCPVSRTYHAWTEQDHSVWIGGSADGAALEWTREGKHAGGIKDLDIVKDLRANEVVA